MAVTDDQMDELLDYAKQMGRDGVLNDPTDDQIIDAIFDYAQLHNMRTEDEFDAIITEQDMPAPEDRRDLIAAWNAGNTEYMRRGAAL